MFIPVSLLMETARRYDERSAVHKQRQPELKKVQWKPNMDVSERVRLLKELDSKERVEKRLKRLSQEAFTYINTATEAVSGLVMQDAGTFDEVVYERVLGQKDLMNINFLEKGSVVARSVGKIILRNSLGGRVGYGTGFLISPRLVMTNNHVLRDSRDALFSQIEFDNQLDLTGSLLKSTLYKLDPASFFVTSKELDVSLVALGPAAGAVNSTPVAWNKLIEEEGKILIGEYMNIIQHPDGRPKEFSFRANQLTDVLSNFLHYQTDTEPGSSGSPVFNDQWEVVGLHHSGVPRRNASGQILNKKGRVWTAAMGDAEVDWIANEGVRISSIIRYIKGLNVQGSARQYRNEILDLEPPKYQLCYLNPEQYSRAFSTGGPLKEEATLRREDDGTFLYTIPVRLKVEVGDRPAAAVQVATPTDGAPAAATSTAAAGRRVSLPSAALQTELSEALRELEVARSRPYYDKAADKKARDNYYGGLKVSGNKQVVFNKLVALMQQTHTTELTYRPAKHLYTWVDLQPNKMLRSIYSGREFEPEKVIEEDFRNELRLLEFSESLLRESGLSDGQMAEKLALFEASLPYNCEHVVPQSWFGKQEPMRGDLHHLFACESGCNSFRGNTPYFDFNEVEEAVRDECGRREDNRFEPENGKGEVARATLYFLLRYPGEINATSKEYTEDRLNLLLDWHQDFQVTEHELHRNAAINAKQGNQNPLIDFPEWAAKIDFLQGLG